LNEKKVARKIVAFALGLVCVILVTNLAFAVVIVDSGDNIFPSLRYENLILKFQSNQLDGIVKSTLGSTRLLDYSAVNTSADTMWVSPSFIDNSAFIPGYTFNATVWLNMTENVFAYEIGLLYNRTQLKCTRAGYTAGVTSNYFAGHHALSPELDIDNSTLGNGSIAAGETLEGSDFIPGPRCASLIWMEFQVLSKGDSTLDISTEVSDETFVLDTSLHTINIAVYNSQIASSAGNGGGGGFMGLSWWLWTVILAALVVLVLGAAFVLRRRKRLTTNNPPKHTHQRAH